MSSDVLIGLISFGIFFGLEYLFPFFTYQGLRVRHAMNNGMLLFVNTVLVVLLSGVLYASVELFHQRFDGLLSVFNQFKFLKIITAVVIFDLWMYAWHRFNHEIYFLWRFHRVHHTDPAMDTSTAIRFHPIEILISSVINVIVLGLLGLDFGFLVLYKSVMTPFVIFHHSNIALSEKWDRWLSVVFIMPNMHRIHHSQIMQETNSNYGSIFSFWDRLFKSFCSRENMKSIVFGIGIFKSNKWQRLRSLLVIPFH